MALVPITILQKHLDTTLQLIISLSSTMTADELIMMRVRLTEASIVLGQVLVELEHNDADVNGKSISGAVYLVCGTTLTISPQKMHNPWRLFKTPTLPVITLVITASLTGSLCTVIPPATQPLTPLIGVQLAAPPPEVRPATILLPEVWLAPNVPEM